MDEEQLNYLLRTGYIPSDRGFQIGQFGPNQNYLGKGMQGLESLGIGPNLNYLGDGTITGSIGVGPNQNYLGKGMNLGSMGQPRYDSGIQTIFPSNISPALSDLGGITPSYGVANETDDEQDQEYIDQVNQNNESGITKLLSYAPFGENSILKRVLDALPQMSPEAKNMRNFYGSRYGLTDTGQVASGIMQGYNPVSGGFLNFISGGRFGKPTSYGLADAARRRIEKIANRKAAQTEASRKKIKELQDFARADTISRARQSNPNVYSRADSLGFTDSSGGFKSAGTNENFSNKTGRGRTGY